MSFAICHFAICFLYALLFFKIPHFLHYSCLYVQSGFLVSLSNILMYISLLFSLWLHGDRIWSYNTLIWISSSLTSIIYKNSAFITFSPTVLVTGHKNIYLYIVCPGTQTNDSLKSTRLLNNVESKIWSYKNYNTNSF